MRNRVVQAAALAAAAFVFWPGSASAYTYKKLYDFCSKFACADGQSPQGKLSIDSGGNLYGAAATGNGTGPGLIFELSYQRLKQKWKYRRLHGFCRKSGCPDGSGPFGSLVVDLHGNVYGTTDSQWSPGCGTVFELEPGTKTKKPNFVVLYRFPVTPNCSGNGRPNGPLTYAGEASGQPYDGISPLYGASELGAANGTSGFVYSLTPTASSWAFAELYDFCQQPNCADGDGPAGDITVDANGNLFGITGEMTGVAYELSPPQWSETVLTTFCGEGASQCPLGAEPSSGLTGDGTGAYLGTAFIGGSRHRGCCGVVYRLAPSDSGWQQSTAYDFCSRRDCEDGTAPFGTLVKDIAGNFYGSTEAGGGNNSQNGPEGAGTVFRLSGSTLETLYAFCGGGGDCLDGANPTGVVMDASGNLFGTALSGGNNADGIIFELTP